MLRGEVSGAVITPFLSDPHFSNTEITFFAEIRRLWLLPWFTDALVENVEVESLYMRMYIAMCSNGVAVIRG